jgi:hypothetical protein
LKYQPKSPDAVMLSLLPASTAKHGEVSVLRTLCGELPQFAIVQSTSNLARLLRFASQSSRY